MERGRKLGFWETGACQLHDQGLGTGTLLCAASIQGAVDLALLSETLQVLFDRHPLLRATLHTSDQTLFFQLSARFSSIPFHIIHRKGEEHWLSVSESELASPFVPQQALWRVVLLSSPDASELILIFHHAIFDGFSSVHLMHELLRLYTDLEMRTFRGVESLPLMPAVENLLMTHPAASAIEQENRQLVAKPAYDYQTYSELGDRQPMIRIAHLKKEQLQALQGSSHHHHLSINSLLFAHLSRAIQSQLGAVEEGTRILSPLNLRKSCTPVPGDLHLGTFVSYIEDRLPVDTTVSDLAMHYEQRMRERISRVGFMPSVFTYDQIPKLCPYFDCKQLLNQRRFASLCSVANKGKFDFPSLYGSLRLSSLYVASSNRMGHSVVDLSTLSTLDKLFLCFNFCQPLVSPHTADAIVDRFLLDIT